MERRVLLAIVLSVTVLLLWQAVFSPPSPPRGPSGSSDREGRGADAPAGPAGGTPGATVAGGEAVSVSRPVAPRPVREGRSVEVRTPLYRATFGPDGAATAWILAYRGQKKLEVSPTLGALAVGLLRPGRPAAIVELSPRGESVEVTAARPRARLEFAGETADGLRVEKVVHVSADSYALEVELRVAGEAALLEGLGVVLYWTSPVAVPGETPDAAWLTIGEGPAGQQMLGRILVAPAGGLEVFEAPAPALQDKKEAPAAALKDPQAVQTAAVNTSRGWVALENDYFIAALLAADGAQLLRGRDEALAEVGVVLPGGRPAPGGAWQGRLTVYAGPKEWDRLRALEAGVERAQARNYGTFLWTFPMEWFCVPLLWLMNFFATRVPGQNYGVAIILLTVLVKVLFYPLSHKSMSSMKQMQALQPQLNALKSKYKADPQRFQREQMDLFRQHKVNPMGGCLPMVVQIPIFYALYLTLQYSVELQGAPFLLWITDLSKKDPYYVLPILMGASMLVQQRMTPTVGDPRQAKLMMFMPIVFTFMFLEFPTGLVLYWLVNNLLSIAQQHLIDRSFGGRAAAPASPAKAPRAARRS